MLSSGLSLESETVLGPVETDSDSHRPLMSDDEEEEVEVYARVQRSIQQHSEPQVESPRAISFCQAFLLPGVLPVSLRHCFKIHPHKQEIIQTSRLSCAAVFPVVRVSEAGQLCLLLLASLLPEQQLQLEGGRGRPPVCVVRRRRNHR